MRKVVRILILGFSLVSCFAYSRDIGSPHELAKDHTQVAFTEICHPRELKERVGDPMHFSFTEKPFVIISSSYKAKRFADGCLKSILNQNYKNYRVICIDDASPDGSGKELDRLIKEHQQGHRVQLIQNKIRVGILENLYKAIHGCRPDEIVVILDGDDELADSDVLATLNRAYQDSNVWMTYGQFSATSQEYVGECSQIPDEVIKVNAFRSYAWVSSHLKTFYAGLFNSIKREDLQVCGQFFSMATDISYMFCMLEMAGFHSKFIDQVLYRYNTASALGINEAESLVRDAFVAIIRAKKPYEPLANLPLKSSTIIDALQNQEAERVGKKFTAPAGAPIKGVNEKPFVIVSTSYKAKQWIERCLVSAFNQSYNNFRIICIDDASPDGSGELIAQVIKKYNQEDRVCFIQNKVRVGALANFVTASQLCHDDEIIVLLDGDDELSCSHVLTILNAMYQNPDVWMTYGQFAHSDPGYVGECSQIPDEVIDANTVREYTFVSSHLKTFYAWLFKRIKREDLQIKGQYFHATSDLAYMIPMLEMAGFHSRFVPQILYIYNTINPISEILTVRALVDAMAAFILTKKPYQQLAYAKAECIRTLPTLEGNSVIINSSGL
jgi:glycosyltransferase involved in cell wall biosynthesis